MQRRRLAASLATLAVASLAGGCGFTPLYGETANAPGGVSDKLRQVDVGLIPDRPGQLLRQALQQRFEGAGGGGKGYLLAVNFSITTQGVATEFATSAQTRVRAIGTAHWSLTNVQGQVRQIATGTAKTVDGYNVVDVQYFYNDLRNEDVIKDIAQELADKITMQVSEYFKNNSSSG
jgi:LPS-assembly lipoprotein